MYTNVYGSFIHNSKNQKLIQMSFNKWMGKKKKKKTIHTMDYYSSIEKKVLLTILNILDESPKNYTGWKKSIQKGHIFYDCIYVILLKWQKL